MSGSLGTASLILTADSNQLDAKLGKKEKDIKSWSSRVGGTMKTGMKLAGGAAGAAVAGITAGLVAINPFERIHDVAKQGDIASSLGITPEAFTGIAGVAKSAGSDTRDFLEGLVTLSGKAMDAAAGSGEETVKIFQQLGIDAQKFASLDAEQQFYSLFEALNKVQNPAEKVNLLLKAVGEDTGKNMVSLLGKSTEELKKQAGGFAISAESMASAQVASQQLKESQAQLDKAFNDITISLAPVASVFADQLPKAIEWTRSSFAEFAPPVTTSLKYVVQGTAALMDVWEAAKSGVTMFVGAVVAGFGTLIEGIGKVIEWADKMGKKLNIDVGLNGAAELVKDFGSFTQKVGFQTIDGGLAEIKKFGANQSAALKWFDNLMVQREQRVQDVAKKLQPGGLVPKTIETKVKVELLKGIEASVVGSAKWQESIARNFMTNKFGEQNKQVALQQQGNQILEAIRRAVSVPQFVFGVL